jgi:hypothetical protein
MIWREKIEIVSRGYWLMVWAQLMSQEATVGRIPEVFLASIVLILSCFVRETHRVGVYRNEITAFSSIIASL